ncbi:MAG: hypothetical protein QOE37_2011 [Microbacteriaceae bacterium]|jgi:hypothetical protein|nr:hypothetical protein [Microbacteriaceae bacterium]
MARNPRTAAPDRRDERRLAGDEAPNPVWFKPIMFGFMLLGLVWILVYYISAAQLPIPSIQGYNILVGFGIALVGFLMTLWWR